MRKKCGNCSHSDANSKLVHHDSGTVLCKAQGPQVFQERSGFVTRFPVLPEEENACSWYEPTEEATEAGVERASIHDDI